MVFIIRKSLTFKEILKTKYLPQLIFKSKLSRMASDNHVDVNSLLDRVQRIIPRLSEEKHKGQAGRIAVIGGSLEYTGAPYFSAISALRAGADLVHIFCQKQAAPVIKSYSPELIVHPFLDCDNALDKIEPLLERIHVVVIGPGLGREHSIMQTVTEIIRFCRKSLKPLIIDADGLMVLQQHSDLLKTYHGVIITPNAIEFSRLFGSEREIASSRIRFLGDDITILEKGCNDRIHLSKTMEHFELPPGGSGRRCGGQGDLLCGVLATFYHWALQTHDEIEPQFIATFAASYMAKQCNAYAFQKHGRSMITSDMVKEIHHVFEDYFEPAECNR